MLVPLDVDAPEHVDGQLSELSAMVQSQRPDASRIGVVLYTVLLMPSATILDLASSPLHSSLARLIVMLIDINACDNERSRDL